MEHKAIVLQRFAARTHTRPAIALTRCRGAQDVRSGADVEGRGIGRVAPRRALQHLTQPKDADYPNIHAAKEPGQFGIIQGFRPELIIPKNKIPLWQKKYMDYHRYHMATGAQNRIYERLAYVRGKASERRRGEQLKLGHNPEALDVTPKMKQNGQLARRIGLPQEKILGRRVGATQAELCRTKSPTNPKPTWCELDEQGNIIPNPMHTVGHWDYGHPHPHPPTRGYETKVSAAEEPEKKPVTLYFYQFYQRVFYQLTWPS
eukprot:1181125-Prorocentrum_minimum.AAC.3